MNFGASSVVTTCSKRAPSWIGTRQLYCADRGRAPALDQAPARPPDVSQPTPASASVFHHRAFRQYWIARVGSVFAYQMQTVAVGWQVYALTGSPLDLGL